MLVFHILLKGSDVTLAKPTTLNARTSLHTTSTVSPDLYIGDLARETNRTTPGRGLTGHSLARKPDSIDTSEVNVTRKGIAVRPNQSEIGVLRTTTVKRKVITGTTTQKKINRRFVRPNISQVLSLVEMMNVHIRRSKRNVGEFVKKCVSSVIVRVNYLIAKISISNFSNN